jgi:hypothetical protein
MMSSAAVLSVTASSRRVLTCPRTLFSWAGVTLPRNALSKWAVMAAAGIGGCTTAANSQRAWAPTGLSGRLAAAAGAVAGADVAARVVAAADGRAGAVEQATAPAVTARAASARKGIRLVVMIALTSLASCHERSTAACIALAGKIPHPPGKYPAPAASDEHNGSVPPTV